MNNESYQLKKVQIECYEQTTIIHPVRTLIFGRSLRSLDYQIVLQHYTESVGLVLTDTLVCENLINLSVRICFDLACVCRLVTNI